MSFGVIHFTKVELRFRRTINSFVTFTAVDGYRTNKRFGM